MLPTGGYSLSSNSSSASGDIAGGAGIGPVTYNLGPGGPRVQAGYVGIAVAAVVVLAALYFLGGR